MIGRIIQSVVYLKYASDELKDIYPNVSLALLEVSKQLISENNIKDIEIEEFQKLVKETVEDAKELE